MKVEPSTSSGLSFFERERSPKSEIPRCRPRKFSSSAFFSTGTMRPQSSATAIPTFTCRWYRMFSVSMDALTIGNCCRPMITARTKNGMKVSLAPWRCSKADLVLLRSCTMRVISTSNMQ